MSPIRRLRSLRRAKLPVDTVELARFLIGKVVVRDLEFVRLIGRIVETEAYPIGDAAGHAFGGKAMVRSFFSVDTPMCFSATDHPSC